MLFEQVDFRGKTNSEALLAEQGNGWQSRELFINLISKQSYNLLVGFFVCFKVLDVILITQQR